MKHTYHITGMTCSGCQDAVTKGLSTLSGVLDVIVNLEKKEAVLATINHISIETLQNALGDKYSISEKKDENKYGGGTISEELAEKSKFQQLKPLFLIFGYITITSV
ncbi:MAG: heavy-metal-associated domain-containing protein, partial [Flavobacteriaceae bacterium]|nr:heavy-metal-associated domain-containing protein [Flavobacteriaceae bacterium]